MRFAQILTAMIAFLCSTALGSDPNYPKADLLIEPAEVVKNSASAELVILDARKRPAYELGHVAGAAWVDHDTWSKAFGDGKDAKKWSELVGAVGVDTNSRVVIYDDNFANDAARIWWILKYWGVKDVRLLNGGWKGWSSGGFPQETVEKPIAVKNFRPNPVSSRLANKDLLLNSLKSGTLQIVDARSMDEHCGTEALKNKKSGAVPGARHLEWIDLIDKNSGRFKPSFELRKIYEEAGVDLNRPTATHCQGGGRAAVMAFGLELMGAKDVRNYYKSWGEWGNADDTPVIKPQVVAPKK